MKIKEIIILIFVVGVFILLFLVILFMMFIGMDYFFSQDACMKEGYNLYSSGSTFPKSSPICEYLNETTMQMEYIKLNP